MSFCANILSEKFVSYRQQLLDLFSQYALPKTPLLLAVSKTRTVEEIKTIYDCGHRHFGENYIQELVSKAPLLPSDISWHFIGHLHTKRCRALLKIPNCTLLESLDSARLATALNQNCETLDRSINVYIQVKTSTEESKLGSGESEADELVNFVLTSCPRLHLTGFMTVADPECPSECFNRLKSFRTQMKSKYAIDRDLELSMGMSDDLKEALQNETSEVRIGTAIFGPRNYAQKVEVTKESSDEN